MTDQQLLDEPASKRVPEQGLSARAQRSRNKLKEAAVTCINRMGFRELRVQDITTEAGVASGLFYRYFQDLNAIVIEITSDLFGQLVSSFDGVSAKEDRFDWMVQVHEIALGTFGENPGILACLFGKSDDENSFSQIWNTNANAWNLKVSDQLVSWGIRPRARAESLSFVLGAVTEGLIYQGLVRRTNDLLEVSGGTVTGLAELIATVWYRTIFLSDPPAEAVRANRLIAAESR
jgi:AcrR family transcriptional regulator